MNDEQRQAIRARANAATQGPWERWEAHATVIAGPTIENAPHAIRGYRAHIAECEGSLQELYVEDHADPEHEQVLLEDQMAANADFIAHAREDVPALLDEVERLAERLRAIETLVRLRLIVEGDERKASLGPCFHGRDPWDRCDVCTEIMADLFAPITSTGTGAVTPAARAATKRDREIQAQIDNLLGEACSLLIHTPSVSDIGEIARAISKEVGVPVVVIETGEMGGTYRWRNTSLAAYALTSRPDSIEAVRD